MTGDRQASREAAEGSACEAEPSPRSASEATTHPAEARSSAPRAATREALSPWPLMPRLITVVIAIDLLGTALAL